MRRFIINLAGFSLLLVLLAGFRYPPDKAHAIDLLLQEYLQYGQFNGSVLVAEKGTVILKRGYGFANFEWEIPNTADTKFRLASITKQFTALLIMQQVERGRLGLDDPIMKYLPDYPKPQGEKVTVRHLLTHTSGVLNYTDNQSRQAARASLSLDSLIAVFSTRPLEFPSGSKFRYSNSGYVLLGAILEKVTGETYERLIQREIFQPLGMENSGYDHAGPIMKKRAAGYERRPSLRNTDFLDMSRPYAAGALYSTVEDLYLWDRALYTTRLLSEKSKTAYFTPFLNNYAFGWAVMKLPIGTSSDSALVFTHAGGINGFNTLIVRVPAEQHLIVLLNNTGAAPLREMTANVLGILYDKPYAGPRRSLADKLDEVIKEKGLDRGLATYKDLKQEKTEYYVDEAELNDLGYSLMQEGKVKEAIEVFKLNVAEFPASWNVYDSLGEAFMTDGQRDPAITNYEKSVSMNPNNTGGIEALKKLKIPR